MKKLFLEQLDVRGKRVLVRVDFNVPLEDGQITDDLRIRESLATIEWLRKQGARVVLMSHLGRPKGKRKPEESLAPAARRLGELLSTNVPLAPDCVGAEVEKLVKSLEDGGVLLLENLRFHKEEEANDSNFARALASLCDVYINDAFGAAHRAHASTAGIVSFVTDAAAGLLMAAELEYLGSITPVFDIIAAYSYIDARITQGDNVGTRVEGIPTHQASLWGKYKFRWFNTPGFSIGAGVRYIGESESENATMKIVTPDHTLFDVMFAWENEQWRFQVNATNLTDRIYFSTCLTRGDCFYGTRRTIMSSLTYKF